MELTMNDLKYNILLFSLAVFLYVSLIHTTLTQPWSSCFWNIKKTVLENKNKENVARLLGLQSKELVIKPTLLLSVDKFGAGDQLMAC